jgi:cation diffusion facilitator CzcD-associated flavoprotein CzcO
MSGNQTPEHFDVLIVGAGISGIDAAYHLQQQCPGKRFALLESKESFGGTWLTHKYPGIRSDSDLHTFGYKWKPWVGNPIATAKEILKYLDEALDENDLRRHIRYQQMVSRASWSSEAKCWTLEVAGGEGGDVVHLTCNFLWMCQGYYRHSEGYTPDFPGMEDFEGKIVHPQTWPEDLDYRDKRVVVIGSGATAATLIPSIAGDCAHVTMLQRSPTYFFAAPNRYDVVNMLRELDIPEEWIHEIARQKKLLEQQVIAQRSFDEPEALKAELIAGIRHYLGDDFDVEKHFTPKYRPWRQRLALVPDGDLFDSINAGKASVVTDQIETFTPGGILTKSGEELAADIIVTATGFNLSVMGDIEFVVDGESLDFSQTCGHRGILFTGVPNLAWIFGYFRTSWTMRADLVAEMVCRLLNHMTDKGVDTVTPQLRTEERDMPMRPLVDPENFNAGYLTRSLDLLPRQGDRAPWLFSQDYYVEKDEIPATDLEDGTLIYR